MDPARPWVCAPVARPRNLDLTLLVLVVTSRSAVSRGEPSACGPSRPRDARAPK